MATIQVHHERLTEPRVVCEAARGFLRATDATTRDGRASGTAGGSRVFQAACPTDEVAAAVRAAASNDV